LLDVSNDRLAYVICYFIYRYVLKTERDMNRCVKCYVNLQSLSDRYDFIQYTSLLFDQLRVSFSRSLIVEYSSSKFDSKNENEMHRFICHYRPMLVLVLLMSFLSFNLKIVFIERNMRFIDNSNLSNSIVHIYSIKNAWYDIETWT
jgi:hypothetical protein